MKGLRVAEWAKAYAALAGLVAAGVLGVTDLPVSWKLPAAVVVALAGAVAVWKIPNAPAETPAVAWAAAGPAWDIYEDPWGDADPYEDDYF